MIWNILWQTCKKTRNQEAGKHFFNRIRVDLQVCYHPSSSLYHSDPSTSCSTVFTCECNCVYTCTLLLEGIPDSHIPVWSVIQILHFETGQQASRGSVLSGSSSTCLNSFQIVLLQSAWCRNSQGPLRPLIRTSSRRHVDQTIEPASSWNVGTQPISNSLIPFRWV